MRNVLLAAVFLMLCLVPLTAQAQPVSATLTVEAPNSTGHVMVHVSTSTGRVKTPNITFDPPITPSAKALLIARGICSACRGAGFCDAMTDVIVECPQQGFRVVQIADTPNVQIVRLGTTILESVLANDSANERVFMSASSIAKRFGLGAQVTGQPTGNLVLTFEDPVPGQTKTITQPVAGLTGLGILQGIQQEAAAKNIPSSIVLATDMSVDPAVGPDIVGQNLLVFKDLTGSRVGVIAPQGIEVSMYASYTDFPTLSSWGLLVLATVLAGGTWWLLKRQRRLRQA